MNDRVQTSTEPLLPEVLRKLGTSLDANEITGDQYQAQHDRLLGEYKKQWADALLLPPHRDLTASLLAETGQYVHCNDVAEVERRCRLGVEAVAEEWKKTFRPGDSQTIEQFYDRSQAYIYDLMWWHTLVDDASPLAYVLALRYAAAHIPKGNKSHLDFGSGCGAGSIVFARQGFDVTLADISGTLLEFCRWRLERRNIPAKLIDLKTSPLPPNAFDVITAMDVFEHLVDPVKTVEELSAALKPGGLLIGRFEPAADLNHPQHIVLDFQPTFKRLAELGFEEVWRDEWLWGHQYFRKSA